MDPTLKEIILKKFSGKTSFKYPITTEAKARELCCTLRAENDVEVKSISKAVKLNENNFTKWLEKKQPLSVKLYRLYRVLNLPFAETLVKVAVFDLFREEVYNFSSSKDAREICRRLKKEGLKYRDISRCLSMDPGNFSRWLHTKEEEEDAEKGDAEKRASKKRHTDLGLCNLFREFVHGNQQPTDEDFQLASRGKKRRQIVWVRFSSEQIKFRNDLIDYYEGECILSGCAILEALEGCHILPFVKDGAYEICNGLLLRRDLHRLFDKYKWSVAVEKNVFKVILGPEMENFSDYKRFKGQELNLFREGERDVEKTRALLHEHYKIFKEQLKQSQKDEAQLKPEKNGPHEN